MCVFISGKSEPSVGSRMENFVLLCMPVYMCCMFINWRLLGRFYGLDKEMFASKIRIDTPDSSIMKK